MNLMIGEIIIGDEPWENFFKHKNLKNLGFKNNDFILNFLKKVSISVVSSDGTNRLAEQV